MGKYDKFKVNLKGMTEKSATFNMDVDNAFFALIEAPELQKGRCSVTTTVEKVGDRFDLRFDIVGTVVVTCDRCLDEMNQPIEAHETLSVKLGDDYGEEGEIVIIPEQDGVLNVAWYLYEFISLAVPMRHVHAPGKCNREMAEKLDELQVDEDGGNAGGDETDPRWDALKGLMDN